MATPQYRAAGPSLHAFAKAGDVAGARDLLVAGADPDEADGLDGGTPLQAAIEGCRSPDERYELVSLLLSHGADPTRLDANATGPLFLALLHQDTSVLELLLRHGADPNAEVGFADKGLLWWARSDYLFETYGRELPEEPDNETWNDIDTLIHYLDALANRHGRARPEALRLLRLYGARF